jgi:2-polyprenyl-3-methyl-5-hydroxy-6-metoxy-1,4-benzoquinol methylase
MNNDAFRVLKNRISHRGVLYLIGVAIFGYLIYNSGILEIKDILLSLDLGYFSMGIFTVIVSVLLLARRWHYLLSMSLQKMEFRNLLGILALGASFGYLFPKLGLGLRIGMLNKYGYSIKESTTSIVLEGILDVTMMLVLALLSSWILFNNLSLWFLVFVFITIFLTIRLGLRWLHNRFKFLHEINFRNIRKAAILTSIIWASASFLIYVLALSIGLRISFIQLSAVFFISYAIGAISLVPGGFGTRDATFVVLLRSFGVPVDISTALTILSRATTMGVFGVMAFGFGIDSQRQQDYLRNLKYRKEEYLKTRQPKASNIVKILESEGVELENKLILDIGSSQGVTTYEFARRGKYVVGIDIDSESIEGAPKKINLGYVVGDGANLPFRSTSIDVVICNHVIEHSANHVGLINEIHRVIKANGICYFACPNRLTIIDPEYGLPFLSFLPKPLASMLLKATNRGDYYYENLPTYRSLMRLLKHFKVKNVTISVIKSEEYFTPEVPKILKRLLRNVPDPLLKIFMPIIRSWILILRK